MELVVYVDENLNPHSIWLICGGRDYTDAAVIFAALDKLVLLRGKPHLVIEGGARGADILARIWANEIGVDVVEVPADWAKHGSKAGPIRNQQMLDVGSPTLVIAFPGGTGTADMSRRAVRAGIELIEVKKDETWNP